MTYTYQGSGVRIEYTMEEGLAVRFCETFGTRSEQVIPFTAMSPELTRVSSRDSKRVNRIVTAVIILLLIPVVVLLKSTSFGLWRHVTATLLAWFGTGLAVCLGAALFGPRVEWAVFRYRSGEPAVAVGKDRRHPEQFEQFVQELRSRVSAA